MASILVVSGKSSGYYFPLEERTMVVGRDEECDIQVLDEKVSREHMRVRFDEESKRYRVSDMKSTNGVVINGQPISEERELKDGDTITIGQSKLFFSVKDFLDADAALSHFKHRGERGKSTLIQD